MISIVGSLFVLLLACLLLAPSAAADRLEIRNRWLRVSWDAASAEFSVRTESGAAFVQHGKLGGEGATAKVVTAETSLGAGQAIELTYADGSSHQIVLPADSPWALVRGKRHNSGSEPAVIRQVPALDARIDLGKPAESLKILGTGGLESPQRKPGSYMWMAVADPQSRAGVVAGWLTTDRGSGAVLSDVDHGQVRLDARIDFGRLRIAPGHSAELETLVLGRFDDARLGLEAYADAVARGYRIKLPPQPCGYCTWYHSGASNEKELAAQAALAAEKLAPYGFSVIQIDDGWQEGDNKGNGPHKNFTAHRAKGPYPSGMKAAADDVRAKGLVPGIWFMPFAGTYNDPWFAAHQAWFVHREDGRPYDTAWGGTCLDMTHPEAQEYLRGVARRLGSEWGYRYFKMDGLYTGAGVPQIYVNDAYRDDKIGDAVFHDPAKTNIEAYRDGLRLVRQTAGPEVFLLGCCANQNMRSYGGAFGLVDAMRVGPDNGASAGGLLTGPCYGSRNYFLHGRVWYNDPDPVYVRTSLALEHARLSCSWAAISGQITVASDAFDRLPPERVQILQRVMPAHGCRARPVDLFDEPLPRIWLVTDDRHEPRRDVIGLFNWSTKTAAIDVAVDRVGLPPGQYAAFDYWAEGLLPPIRERLTATVPPLSCRVLAVRATRGEPQLLSTSRHVTQGMVDVVAERWDAARRELSGTSRVVGGDP